MPHIEVTPDTQLIKSLTFARGGYHVFTNQDYESRVRGGHNFLRVRVKDSRVGAITEAVDILLALNRESIASSTSGNIGVVATLSR